MKLQQLNNLIQELNFKINKKKDIINFLSGLDDVIIRIEGRVYTQYQEEDVYKVKELLRQYQERILELEEMDI